ncbi:uncharacterized protein J8A68_003259 [[Candida] subhashii]|uniref:DUF1748-domain-containing protein n=1 Tax=[Candida] subhashii TaxID=561895 RepID=A0A8J5UYQ8_9ASCO|nr:uncharacterized protein J8A68_003259 [[Candida] subhashii]KAG7663259.1 hypothetical protein J8A68_003259 [[Candida] subhashii]
MLMLGKIAHIGIDLCIVSGFLAGVHRSTGLTPNLNTIENEQLKYYVTKYLDIGESMFDFSVGYFNSSTHFSRNNRSDK